MIEVVLYGEQNKCTFQFQNLLSVVFFQNKYL